MWNTETWRESEEDIIAENHASAGSEDQANPSSAKRQRRPSVRLEELGDQHASPLTDKRKKKTGKALSTGVCVSNGELHKQCSFNVGDDAERTGNALPGGSAEPCPAFEKAPSGNKMRQILKITDKKVRNGGRKSGVPKVTVSVKKLPCVPQSGISIGAHYKQKVPRMQDAKDMHFDKENNAHSPARFEASGYQDVVSPCERREGGDSHLKYQSGEYLPARAQAMGERANQWMQASSRMQAFKLIDDADGKRMAHANWSLRTPKGKLVVRANGLMHGTRNKAVVEANGNGETRERSKKNAARQCSQPWLGVREWLQDLGLGKYAQIFEAHEVEPEVLPLLTLDDLREMGVAAVGSRRKMFSAIQHIRKVLLAEAE